MPDRIVIAATAAAIAAMALPAPARADSLQATLLASMRATRADGFTFQRTMVMQQSGSARNTIVERYDPRRAAADRWSLVSIDGHAPTARDVDRSRKAKRGPVPSYATLADWFGTAATRSDTAPGYATYRFPRLPARVVMIGSHDASADTQAEALVNLKGTTPYVERVRFTSAKGFRMMMVVSVQAMTLDSRYVPLASGAIVPDSAATTMKGSVMGKSGQIDASVTYAAFQPVR